MMWPRLVPVALGAGFRSVHALPIRLRGHVVGALNLFRYKPGMLGAADALAAQALADAAAIAILQQRALQDARLLASQLQTALSSRIIIEQAKGMTAQFHGVNIDEAFSRLRRFARHHNQLLTAVCTAVVAGEISLAQL